jgi:hypothetical protein
MAKKTAPKPPAKAAKPKAAKPKAAKRTRWLDPKTNTPLLREYAEQMQSFLKAMADGVIEDSELQQQEKDVAALMAEVEPLLDDELHEKVTRLLCEVAVYDMMQMVQAIQASRPVTRFRG